MSALRKAGVWLGLIEDEDERYGYDERGYDEEYADDDMADPSAVVRARVADRLAEARAERDAARLAAERADRRSRADHASRIDHASRVEPDRSHIRDTEPTTVRAMARPVTVSASAPIAYPTR